MMKYKLIAIITASLAFIIAASKPEQHVTRKDPNNTEISQSMPASMHLDSIVLGAGCFWGAEKRYAAIPGVINAISGYADGVGVKPVYQEIIKLRHKNNPDNHAEVVKVTYNQSEVNLEGILRYYFEGHDPTQLNRQGNDTGTQYRSTILTNSPVQAAIAQKVLNQYQVRLTAKGFGQIVTKIKPITEFFPAEEYHQDYLVKNPDGYCPEHSTGVKFVALKKKKSVDNAHLLKGQQIVVIDSSSDCPFCEKFRDDIVSNYNKSTPITFRKADELKDLSITTPTWATPTILFLNNGKEVFGHQGYMNEEAFYKVHTRLKFH